MVLAVVLLLMAGTPAWSQMRHTDYATMMNITLCNDCHVINNVAPNHDSGWIQEHKLSAEKHPNNCNDCHHLSFCFSCHEGGGLDQDMHKSNFGPDYMPRSHRTDFREIHPIKAREDPRACYRCHDAERFCNECHNKFKPDELAPVSHRRQFSDIKLSSIGPQHALFNPSQCRTCHINGALPEHRWSSEHAREARRNLSSCQTCHPDGQVCMKCHSAETGLRISPHPRNWSAVMGNLRNATDGRTCLKCHRTVPR
jgi:hypothetical protein